MLTESEQDVDCWDLLISQIPSPLSGGCAGSFLSLLHWVPNVSPPAQVNECPGQEKYNPLTINFLPWVFLDISLLWAKHPGRFLELLEPLPSLLGDRREFWQGYSTFVITTQRFLLWKKKCISRGLWKEQTPNGCCTANGDGEPGSHSIPLCMFAWFKQRVQRIFRCKRPWWGRSGFGGVLEEGGALKEVLGSFMWYSLR